MKNELFVKKQNTTYLNTEVLKAEKINRMMKEEIMRFNKDITDCQKDKENTRSSLLLLKKHILILKEKIKEQVFSSNERTLSQKASSQVLESSSIPHSQRRNKGIFLFQSNQLIDKIVSSSITFDLYSLFLLKLIILLKMIQQYNKIGGLSSKGV